MQKIDFSLFPKEREEKLKSIHRFSLFEVAYYRSNLWQHSHRVLWLLEELIPVAKKYLEFDPDKARVLALVHDDAEMITGDFQAGHKARMSEDELKNIEQLEKRAVEQLTAKYPKEIIGYEYKELLLHAANKDCIEAKLVSYIDKVDAYCESMHELLAGNIGFLRSVIFYVKILTEFPKKFPKLSELLSSKESPLTYLSDICSPEKAWESRYTHINQPHTKETIKIETDFPFYNTWRELILKNDPANGLPFLTTQKEFFKK